MGDDPAQKHCQSAADHRARGGAVATIVEFPKAKGAANRAARRAARSLAASKPRRSKNGTPEERAAKAGRVVERAIIPRRSKNGTPEERAAKRATASVVEIAPRGADRIVASVVKLLGKDEGDALLKFVRQADQSDPGPSAA